MENQKNSLYNFELTEATRLSHFIKAFNGVPIPPDFFLDLASVYFCVSGVELERLLIIQQVNKN